MSWGSQASGSRTLTLGRFRMGAGVAYRGMRRIHVILDNYGIHKSNAVAGFLRRCGERLRLHFLPPYCPDHNKIERVWGDVHANVTRNHRKPALRELLDEVQIYLARRFLLWVGTCVNV